MLHAHQQLLHRRAKWWRLASQRRQVVATGQPTLDVGADLSSRSGPSRHRSTSAAPADMTRHAKSSRSTSRLAAIAEQWRATTAAQLVRQAEHVVTGRAEDRHRWAYLYHLPRPILSPE